ncbi:unnamed protein product [Didymodactylos carnosus]|uniref:Knr4/Smi1-like domain-containing protein n=1 Tax=Didymodactylos carnosus TaxID=1234261 RepID=A0A815FZJ3_9BILA|nr:unnamed protein product [Didymodactylos carnosus]CAF1331978.1 unnamed protein product [Didymodactylos carnosus]CAF3765985.1 unnamed protein product [Didymodactylos carnosus]CAF4186179.1 unnamed protein product [Didymodactylos carnosus]
MLSSSSHEHLWTELNNSLSYAPRYQNKTVKGITSTDSVEKRLQIKLPEDAKETVRVHNGRRQKIGYGLIYRLPTTDLLPIDQWRPYEHEEWFENDFLKCLQPKPECGVELMLDDIPKHFEALKKSNYKMTDEVKKLPCELLVIGEGADDYGEQLILGLKTGKIFVGVHNIPEWQLVADGFKQWLELSIKTAKEDRKDDIKEQHDDDDDDDEDKDEDDAGSSPPPEDKESSAKTKKQKKPASSTASNDNDDDDEKEEEAASSETKNKKQKIDDDKPMKTRRGKSQKD